jgi:hypothetical protein
MIPSKRWFPTTLNERAAWMRNFAKQFETVALSLGFSAADIDSMNKDAQDFQAVTRAITSAEAFMAGLRAFRVSLSEEKVGSPKPVFPTLTVTPPPNDVPAGIFQRLDERVRRVRAAAAYTDEIGALLKIMPARSESIANSELMPAIKAAARPGNIVEIRFTRGDTDGISLQMRLDKEEDWKDAGRFVRSPARLEIPDGTGLPRAVQIRARYIIGNDPVGQNSDIVTVVTTP